MTDEQTELPPEQKIIITVSPDRGIELETEMDLAVVNLILDYVKNRLMTTITEAPQN